MPVETATIGTDHGKTLRVAVDLLSPSLVGHRMEKTISVCSLSSWLSAANQNFSVYEPNLNNVSQSLDLEVKGLQVIERSNGSQRLFSGSLRISDY
jgi:hypothetical protein